MRSFSEYKFDELLPPYLTSQEKGRLQKGLQQFIVNPQKNKIPDYSNFYINSSSDYLMQSDLLNSVKMISWDEDAKDFKTGYISAMLISSTCDLSKDNIHTINKKEALFAPIIAISEFCADLKKEGYSEDRIKAFYDTLRKQEFSNLFYIPKNEKNENDYMVFLDKVSWFPATELINDEVKLNDLRFISLSNFGFYLFILKLSYHFCRLPEEADRSEISNRNGVDSISASFISKTKEFLTRRLNEMLSISILWLKGTKRDR